MKQIKVVVVDDHPIVRTGVKNTLQSENDIEVVAEATTGKEALIVIERLRPDVVILDIEMPELDGTIAARLIRERYPDIRVIVLSAHSAEQYVLTMLRRGVSGYILKENATEDIVSAVRTALRGETWLSPQIAQMVVWHATHKLSVTNPDEFTERELDVLQLLTHRCSDNEIAERLGITRRTVRFHLGNIFRKLGVHNRTEAMDEATRRGLIVGLDHHD